LKPRSSPPPRKLALSATLAVLGFATTAFTAPAWAQASEAPAARSGPRNLFDFGLWQATHDHRLQAGLRDSTFSGGLGEAFSLESDFGLRRKNDITTLGYTRLIGAAWHFSLDRLENERSATATTPRSLFIFGQTLPAGTVVSSSQRFAYTSVAGGLALLQRGDTEFGVRFGGGSVRDRVSYRWPSTTYESNLMNIDLLPLLGLFVSARAGATLQFDARVDHLRERSSRSTLLRAGLRWQPKPYIGVEAAYWRLSGTSTPDDDIFTGNEESRYKLSGPRVALRLAF
jgi:hypothetical protein